MHAMRKVRTLKKKNQRANGYQEEKAPSHLLPRKYVGELQERGRWEDGGVDVGDVSAVVQGGVEVGDESFACEVRNAPAVQKVWVRNVDEAIDDPEEIQALCLL
eukprot:2108020-Rhodomonas_salina.1